ncbi:MAG: hypothetical protein RR555_01820 [Bacteroidales bacterium]
MEKTIQSKIFLYSLPVYYIYNMLLDVVFNRGSAAGIVLNMVVLAMLVYFSMGNPFNKKFWYLFVWFTFNIILILCNSSNIQFSSKVFCINAMSMLCFPLAFNLISTNQQIVLFLKVLIAVLLLYILNLILANTLDWGQAYGDVDSDFAVQGGASIVTGSMPVVIALMMAPVIFYLIPQKKYFIGLWALTTVCMFLIFKRTNIASLVIGYVLFYAFYKFYNYKLGLSTIRVSRKTKIRVVIGGLSLLILFALIFGKIILAQLDMRGKELHEVPLQDQGRVVEWRMVKEVILESNNTGTILFGKEPYNTSGNYGDSSARNIHGDFSIVLFSTGVVGFIYYWGMQIFIALLIFKYAKRRYIHSTQDILFFSAYASSSLIWFICSFSATLDYFLVSAVYYMTHGAILRYFWNKYQVQERLKIIQAYDY